MAKIVSLLAALPALASVGVATSLEAKSTKDPAASKAEVQIMKVMAERKRAMETGDTEAVSREMTEDYIQTDVSGRIWDKATWLKEYFSPMANLIKSGKSSWTLNRCNLRFSIHRDVAVVMGRADMNVVGASGTGLNAWVADPSHSFSRTFYFTHVYRRKGGRWLLAALQNEVAVGPASPNDKCR